VKLNKQKAKFLPANDARKFESERDRSVQ